MASVAQNTGFDSHMHLQQRSLLTQVTMVSCWTLPIFLRQLPTVHDFWLGITLYGAFFVAKTFKLFHDVHAAICLVYFAENNVLAIQPRCRYSGNEELRSIPIKGLVSLKRMQSADKKLERVVRLETEWILRVGSSVGH